MWHTFSQTTESVRGELCFGREVTVYASEEYKHLVCLMVGFDAAYLDVQDAEQVGMALIRAAQEAKKDLTTSEQ